MTTYYKATFSNGAVRVRSTARKYSHAHTPAWRSAQWASTEARAHKAARGGELAPAIEITRQEYQKHQRAESDSIIEAHNQEQQEDEEHYG